MTSWIFFVFIAQGIWAFTTLIDKFVISKGHIRSPFVYVVLNGLMNILIIFLLPFFDLEPLSFADFLVLILSGATFTAAMIFYYKAVQYDEISRIAILYQLGPVFVFILSFLFLEDTLTKNHFIGFIFLLIAGIIVSYRRTGKKFRFSKAFLLMLISMLFSSISFVSAKHIFDVTSFWNAFLWLRLSGFTSIFVLFSPSVRNQFIETYRANGSKTRVLLGFKMLIDFIAFIFAGYALQIGQAPLVSALASTFLPLFVFLLTVIISIYFPRILNEKIDKKAVFTKILAIALIVIGIMFVNF